MKCAAFDPGEVMGVERSGAPVAGRAGFEHPEERENHAADGDGVDYRLRQLAPKDAVDQESQEREGRNEPEFEHQFLRVSISSMFRVERFLNTVRMMASP